MDARKCNPPTNEQHSQSEPLVSLGSRSRDHDSDAEMNDAEYVAGSSEEEDGSGVANAEAGPSTRKGKEREISQRRGRRKVGQSKYFA
ncbi:hypothetical protein NMY22_g19187 [Coprinellus aureogranulatus]|nr:hypothetical protein NMY22_g19187 [Coprinellus aureogranulatus]